MQNAIPEKLDFTQGKVLKKLILFSVPIMLATLMQMLFNAADVIIIGRFGGDPKYQAAVGATSSATHLIVNLFMGIALGANVVMSTAVGARDEQQQDRVLHTSVATSLASGVLILVLGMIFSRPLLALIKTPSDIIDYSTLYMQIYFAGAPAMMVYNFASSLLRSAGETKKPIYYLAVAGVLNVIINAVTVIFFGWHVVGVALGTTVSQYVSAVWITVDLCKGKAGIPLHWKKIRFYKKEFNWLMQIGIPSGLNSSCFSLSNIFMQSSVNAFGSLAIAGNTVSSNLDTIADAFASSIEKAVITFVGQNVGAKKPERIHKITFTGLFLVASIQVFFGLIMLFFGKFICLLYNPDTAVMEWAMKRVIFVNVLVILNCGMYIFSASLRGMGRSVFPMIVNVTFSCIVRILYMLFVYPALPTQTIEFLYIIYPISWIFSSIFQGMFYFICERNLKRTLKYEAAFENKNVNP